jgi:hypothetical protein
MFPSELTVHHLNPDASFSKRILHRDLLSIFGSTSYYNDSRCLIEHLSGLLYLSLAVPSMDRAFSMVLRHRHKKLHPPRA